MPVPKDFMVSESGHTVLKTITIAGLNQSQGGMCICWVLGIGAGISRECFGP